jgi:peptide/nickel transport system substrate-binding protein
MITRNGRMTRRSVMQGSAALGAGLATAGMPGRAPGAFAAMRQDEEGVRGGTLMVGTIGEPATLDEHTTTTFTAELMYPVYETLFTYDADYNSVPELVDTHTVSEDGLTHTMTLRQGITFHNGEPMTAADVHASVTRWAGISGVGQNLFENVDEFVEVDEHTVEFRLSQPYGTILTALSHNTQACTIHPKSIMDAAGETPFTDDSMVVGTGPYRFVERQADAYIRLERFDDFVSREEPTNGYAGAKHAWVDEIEYIPVPDVAARVAGLQAGDYHYAMQIPNDQYELLANTPGVVAEIKDFTIFECFFLNWRSPLMGNLAMREAFRAALNHEEILIAAHGTGDFTRLDPGWMMQQTAFYTTSGEELYNVNDPELAAQKLEEAEYDGTPLRFMTSQEYPSFYAASVIAQQQLEAAGFTIDLQVIDWATLLERRGQEGEWDVFCTSHGFVPDPSQITLVGQMGTYPGWYDSEASMALAEELLAETDFEARYALWEELQHNIYTEIPSVKVGDAAEAAYYSEQVGGWPAAVERGVPYWNLWLKDA